MMKDILRRRESPELLLLKTEEIPVCHRVLALDNSAELVSSIASTAQEGYISYRSFSGITFAYLLRSIKGLHRINDPISAMEAVSDERSIYAKGTQSTISGTR